MSRAVLFTRRVAFAVVAVVAVGALALGFDGAAVAHSEFGLMTLEAVAGAEAQSAELRARVVYANDREPVSSAAVTVEGSGPGGAVLAAVPMTGGTDGVYTVSVRLPAPGAWTLRATSVTPEATAEATFTAVAPPSSTAPPARDGAGEGDGDARPPTGSAASAEADGQDGTDWLVPVAVAVVALAGLAAVAVLRGRRARVG